MKKTFFLIFVIFVSALLLTGCSGSILPDPEETAIEDGLFLKSAQEGERMTSAYYINNGQGEKFTFPNNLLFELKGGEAQVLNSLLIAEDFYLGSSSEEVVFRVKELADKSMEIGTVSGHPRVEGKKIYSSESKNVVTSRLPFTFNDFEKQSNEGQARFNGLLKAGIYVLAIKENQVLIYNLDSKETITSSSLSTSDDVFSFTVDSQVWDLSFKEESPIGNLFTLSTGDETMNCYTLIP